MSEDNMEELQRWAVWDQNDHVEDKDGMWVRFSDVAEREARLNARIEELEVIVSGKTMYDAAAVADARWRERIEGALTDLEDFKCGTSPKRRVNEDRAKVVEFCINRLRASLLDSGEEHKCPDCRNYGGEGFIWKQGSWPENCPTCRATPSPALLEESNEECPACGGWGSIEYTNGPLARCGRCSGSGATRSPAPTEQGEGPSLPADQVAVNREEKECPDWSDAEIRAAVAAFRATDTEETE